MGQKPRAIPRHLPKCLPRALSSRINGAKAPRHFAPSAEMFAARPKSEHLVGASTTPPRDLPKLGESAHSVHGGMQLRGNQSTVLRPQRPHRVQGKPLRRSGHSPESDQTTGDGRTSMFHGCCDVTLPCRLDLTLSFHHRSGGSSFLPTSGI